MKFVWVIGVVAVKLRTSVGKKMLLIKTDYLMKRMLVLSVTRDYYLYLSSFMANGIGDLVSLQPPVSNCICRLIMFILHVS